MTDILAVDLATTSGWARGDIYGQPTAGAISFRNKSVSRTTDNMVFANCVTWISALLKPEPRPDILIMEALLPGAAKFGQTTSAVYARLAGLHGVVRGVAHLRGIGEISTASVGDVRAHFIGDRCAKREVAKRLTVERCKALGWPVTDDNSGDALALWSFATSLIDPKLALRPVPMFNKRLALG